MNTIISVVVLIFTYKTYAEGIFNILLDRWKNKSLHKKTIEKGLNLIAVLEKRQLEE